jgi:methylsterol monooxygenase
LTNWFSAITFESTKNKTGIVLSIQIPFWSVGILFAFVDYYNWPKWIMRYKIQPGTNEPVDLNKLAEVFPLGLIQIAVNFSEFVRYFMFVF